MTWRERVGVWLIVTLLAAAAVAAMWVGGRVVDELDRRQLEECWERSPVCERVDGRWRPAATTKEA